MNGKNILFVLARAGMGGSCASMINLLSLYKERGITFDVFLMEHTGVWTQTVAQYGNLLPEDVALSAAIKEKSQLRGFRQYLHRLGFVLHHRLLGRDAGIARVYKAAAKKLSNKYDHVIAYQESETTEFVSYIAAPHKIAWVHTDFRWYWDFAKKPDFLSGVYKSFDEIVCVTQSSLEGVIEKLQWDPNRVQVVKNTLPPKMIYEKACIPKEQTKKRDNQFLIVSIGRLNPEKAFHRIPRAAQKLKAAGCNFEWYVIGDGVTRQQIEEEIKDCDLGDCVLLLGAKMNPYPYIKEADCLVITSVSEAQPMVANEALILDKPVISTEFASVREVIKDGENGMIVQQTPEAIAEALKEFMCDAQLRQRLQDGAKAFCYNNDDVLAALDALLT